jgi:NAD(P)H-hydrate epimerase
LEYITPDEMTELERRAVDYGLTVERLMENAGKAVAEFALSRYGPAMKVCVVCGSGNNGGDGSVAARYLSKACPTKVVLLTGPEKIKTPEARKNWERLGETTAQRFVAEDKATLKNRLELFEKSDVIVVAILGTGMRGGVVKEPLATAIDMGNASIGVKIAVDLPSGLDPNSGAAAFPTVRADVTLALHLPKTGLRGRQEYTGEIVILPIGIRGWREA